LNPKYLIYFCTHISCFPLTSLLRAKTQITLHVDTWSHVGTPSSQTNADESELFLSKVGKDLCVMETLTLCKWEKQCIFNKFRRRGRGSWNSK